MAKKTYSLTATYNGETVKKSTDNLDETIKELRPDWLHTEMYLTVKKGKQVAERRVKLVDAKKIFNNEVNREVFINNLLISL